MGLARHVLGFADRQHDDIGLAGGGDGLLDPAGNRLLDAGTLDHDQPVLVGQRRPDPGVERDGLGIVAIDAPGADQVMLAAGEASATMDKAEEAVSDTWITSKVKSAFVAEKSLSALDIKVETNKGVVALSGVVSSDAERDLAIAKAKEIKGVKAVSADGLKSAD